MLLEFNLGKLACEVDQWNCRPQSWGRGIPLSIDLTQLANLFRQGYRPVYVVVIQWLPWRVLGSTGPVPHSTHLFSGTMVLWKVLW